MFLMIFKIVYIKTKIKTTTKSGHGDERDFHFWSIEDH